METTMNCETCNAKLPTLRTRLLRVNETLYKLGLEYHTFLPVYKVDEALEENGFHATEYWNEGNCVRVHEEVGDGKWLSLYAHKMDSGRWEVTAYVN
jgi:hypothetical protein